MFGPPLWTAPFQGIPFRDRAEWRPGDDPYRTGLNCWQLVRLVYARCRGIVLPAHGAVRASDALAVGRLMRAGAAAWQPVGAFAWRDFDVVLLASYNKARGRLTRYPGHVGVVAVNGARGFILHVEDDIESLCVPATDPGVTARILSVHRYPS